MENNYTYGQGMFDTGRPLFFTPVKLNPAKYEITVKLDMRNKTFTGEETIRWRNTARLPVRRLCIDRGALAENGFSLEEINGTTPDAWVSHSNPEPVNSERPAVDAAVSISVTYYNDKVLVDFPEPLALYDLAVFKIKFAGELRPSPFHGEDVYEMPSYVKWHPRLYWDEPVGGHYSVTFENLPEEYQIFAPGARDGWTFTERNIALSFGFAISQKLVVVSETVRNTVISVAHFPKYAECAAFMLESAVQALNFFVGFVGFYPYRSFTILPGSSQWYGGGNFAGGIVYAHNFESYDPNDPQYIEYYKALVPHEIGHQYWGEFVIENERPDWLWLGLSIALDREYSRFTAGLNRFHQYMAREYFEYLDAGKNTTLTLPAEEADRALNHEDNEYGDNYHGAVCHGKGFLITSMLMDVIGKERFFAVLRSTLREYGGKALYTADFIRNCEEYTGMRLNWFFNPWLKSNRTLNGTVEDVTETEAGGVYTVTARVGRKDSIPAPVCAAVYFKDGSEQIIFTERLLDAQILACTASSPYEKIVLDPFEVYAMKKKEAGV